MRHCGGDAVAEAWQEEEPLVALYVTTPSDGDGFVTLISTASDESPNTFTSVGAITDINLV